jgi:hypothetical protein
LPSQFLWIFVIWFRVSLKGPIEPLSFSTFDQKDDANDALAHALADEQPDQGRTVAV